MVKAMCKSNFAVKKISYGKPPYMLSGNTFYALTIKTPCDIEGCGASMHIEVYNGEFIAVCDADRAHLRRLDCSLFNKNKQEQVAQEQTAQDNIDNVENKVEELSAQNTDESQMPTSKN